MGLDITAYSQLTDKRALGEGYEYDYEVEVAFYTQDTFPGRAEGIDKNRVYAFAEKFGFSAGSYGGYNEWRNRLAQMAGYKNDEHAWASDSGPFWELINYPDNEGVFAGPAVSKLLADFVAYQEKADAIGDYFAVQYRAFRKAFALAVDGGAVKFH